MRRKRITKTQCAYVCYVPKTYHLLVFLTFYCKKYRMKSSVADPDPHHFEDLVFYSHFSEKSHVKNLQNYNSSSKSLNLSAKFSLFSQFQGSGTWIRIQMLWIRNQDPNPIAFDPEPGSAPKCFGSGPGSATGKKMGKRHTKNEGKIFQLTQHQCNKFSSST